MPVEPDNDDIADALSRMADGLPDKPQRPAAPPGAAASAFRTPASPSSPDGAASRPPAPSKTPAAKPRPARPDRPDRPAGPPTTQWSDDEAAEVRAADSAESAEYNPLSAIVDDDAVIVPAPDAEVFAPHAPLKETDGRSVGVPRSLEFRRTVIPILLTCGVLLIGIGSLRWLAGSESLFSDMSVALCGTLCGVGVFLLIVAALNMLQVKAELAAAEAKRPS